MTRSDLADRIWTIARPVAWLLVAAALIAPAVAVRFTTQVRWTAQDFATAAILLVGGGLVCEVFAWRVRNSTARVFVSLLVAIVVALVWGLSVD